MTEEQYWDKDNTLTIAYRKAEELRKDRKNQELWIQGAYFYDALCRVSPVLHAFAKSGAKPVPYVEKEYALNDKQIQRKREEDVKKAFEKGKCLMTAFAAQHTQQTGEETKT